MLDKVEVGGHLDLGLREPSNITESFGGFYPPSPWNGRAGWEIFNKATGDLIA